MGFSRQEHWSGLPFSSPEDLPNPGTEPTSPALQVDSLPLEPSGHPRFYLGYCGIALYFFRHLLIFYLFWDAQGLSLLLMGFSL